MEQPLKGSKSEGSPGRVQKSVLDSPGRLMSDDDDEDASSDDSKDLMVIYLKLSIVFLVVVGAPYFCRGSNLSSPSRCVVVIMSVLILNLAEVMPLYCTALFIPVLGTLCAVLGESRGMVDTSSLLVANIFTNVSFLVLGALVINGIFVKCRLERRLMAYLRKHFEPDDPYFLLFLMLGGMAMCSVLYSGSLVLLSALRPLLATPGKQGGLSPGVAKRLLLGVAFCSNAGSVWLPISSPVNLITIALLGEFDHTISLTPWVMVSIPVSTLAMLATWPVLLYAFPDYKQPRSSATAGPAPVPAQVEEDERVPGMIRSVSSQELKEEEEAKVDLTWTHYFFIFVSVLALLCITVFMPYLQPYVGHAACISLSVVVMAFGSGFMSREEFLHLEWDLLALVGGTNVMAFLVRETGLGAELSASLISSEFVTALPYISMLAILIITTVVVSTTVGHTLTGVLILPLIVALGVKLQAAETTALLCAVAVPFGMGLPHSSFDNASALNMSNTLGRKKVELTQKDFRFSGGVITVVAVILLLILGFGTCVFNFGMPPPVVVSEISGTPEKLKPKVVRENRPEEAEEVSYNKLMGGWKAFLEKPDKKAFAVGQLKPGLKTRPWAASWNHKTQEEANEAALTECERLAGKCRLIYPEDKGIGKGARKLESAGEKVREDAPAKEDPISSKETSKEKPKPSFLHSPRGRSKNRLLSGSHLGTESS